MAEGFDRYPMDAEPRGYCVIFNNINFNQDFLTTREGSQKDADDLENLFSYKLGFKVLRYNDMSETEMMLNMEALRERDHGIFCAFVLIILSHGDRGIIYSSDSKKIPIKNISNMFTAINCPSLIGKPKIFIIQACQGQESMKAIAARSYQNEYLTRPTRVVHDGILIDSDTIPNEADFLFAFATISGHTAMRDIYDGGWYIQELVKSLDKYSNTKSVTEILTNVAAQTAKYQYDQKTQLPPYQSGLLKTLYFPNATRYHMTGSTLQESKRSIVFSRSTLSLRSIPSDSELTTSKNNSTSSLKFINTSTLPGSPCLVKQNRKRHSTDPASLSLSPCVRSQQSLRRLNTTPSIITALPMQQKVNPNFQNDEHNSPITKSRKIPLTNPFSISQRSLSGVTSAHDIIKPSSTPSTGHSTPSTSITDIHVPHDRVLKIESPPITIINKSDITPTSPQNLQTFNKAEIQSQTSTDSSQRSLQESLLQVPVYSKSETVSQATSRSESSPFSSKENLDVKENVCEKSTENIEAKIVAYKMTSIPCGYCILIDNHNTDATVTAVKNARNVLCIDYGFHVENFSNLSRKGIKQLMKAVSRVDHNNLNCLMVIILSHGGKEKGIYDTHGKQISVEDVTETFSIEKCPSLKKKPKIFFFETILNNTAIVSTCSSIHYPDMRDTHTCTIVCSTTESASVLCLQIMAETLQMQLDSAQFVNIVRDVEKLLYEKQIRNVDIETNNFLEQPLIFPRRQKIDNREEEGRFVAIEIKMALRVWSQMRNITIEKIRKNRERIIKVCKEVRRIKIAGSATSIAGGVLTVLGLGLTPVTLGGSIAISVVGGSIALAGGAASVSATVFNKIMSKSKLRKVQDIIEVDQQLCRIIEILEENLQRIAEDIQRYHLDTDKKDIVVALLHGSKLVQITSVVAKGGVAGSQVARIGGTTAIQGGLFAFRLGSTAVRGVAIAGGIVSLLILPFDIYELTTNAYKIHKHSESKSACMQWLNEQLEKLTTQKQEIEICLEEIERRNSESTSSYSTEV